LQNIGRCRLVCLHGFWPLHFFLGRHTFLVPVGMYSYTKFGMDVLFMLSKSRVPLTSKNNSNLFERYKGG
jgi:hypothetical protein